MTEDTKAPGGLEASAKAIDPVVENSAAESTKDPLENHVVDDLKVPGVVDTEKNSDEVAKAPSAGDVKKPALDEAPENESKDSIVDEVEEPSVDEEKAPGPVTQKDDHSEGVINDIGATQAEEASKNGDSNSTKTASDRVLEGQKWNNRDREKRDFKKNVKSELISQEESSDPVAIRKQVSSAPIFFIASLNLGGQVEFYFSNSNLLQDKFLYSKVEGHQNLPVPISIISSFQRMRHFKPHSAIVEALKESKILNVVENDSCIQRKEALPEDFKDKPMDEIVQVHEDEAMTRSVYAKGFGEEKPSTQFDIEAFFAEHGSTNSVRLRRTHERVFKGSVFVEFDSEETQQTFLALDPKPKWKGSDLVIKSKKQYCEEKVEEIKSGRMKPNTQWRIPYDSKLKSRGQGGKGTDRDWRDRRNEDQKGGFKDKRGGGHKGFGSSGRGGRGRGGARGGGRGGRDNRDKRRNGRDAQYEFFHPLDWSLLV